MDRGSDATGQLPTRTAETTASYAKRVQSLRRAAEQQFGSGLSLCQVAEWLGMQDYEYAEATVRQYRAAILAEASEALAVGNISQNDHAEIRWLLHQRPIARTRGPRRTSARKRKSMSTPEYEGLIESLMSSGKVGDRFLATYVVMGVTFFLRPCEWAGAKLEGTQLVVANAKATNGRSHGHTRNFDLAGRPEYELKAVQSFLSELRKRAAEAGSFASATRRVARSLTRACRRLGIKPIAPYSLRHIGIASAKRQIGLRMIAYLAGHGSDRTAGTYYARARTGLPDVRVTFHPTTEQTEKVRVGVRHWSVDHIARARMRRAQMPVVGPPRFPPRESSLAAVRQHQAELNQMCGIAEPRM